MLYQDNGDVFTGFFKNGKPFGQGKLDFANGDSHEGTFENGVLNG